MGNRNTFGYAARVATRLDAMFDTQAPSTAHRRSSNLADRDTQLRCHGRQIGDTNVRWLYASRVMPWLIQAPMNLVEFVVDRFLALDVLAVQLFDQLAGRLLSAVVGVMAGAQHEPAAGRLVGTRQQLR
jgi:hypothetical protein